MNDDYKILLMEKNFNVVELIGSLLKSGLGHEFVLEYTGRLSEAIQMATEHSFGIVLLDMNLDDSSGLDTLLDFRNLFPDLPVIALTDLSDDRKMGLEAVKAGAQDYLSKDNLNDQMLARCIRYACERVNLTNQLFNKNNQINLFLDIMSNLIMILDQNAKIKMLNNSSCDLLQTTKSDALGQDWFNLCVPKNDRKHMRKLFSRQLKSKSGTSISYEGKVISSDNKIFNIDWNSSLLINHENKQKQIMLSGQDKTQKQKDDRIIKMQSAALSAANDGVVITETDGTILWANPAMSKLTGYSIDEMVGHNTRIFKSGLQTKEFYKKMWDTITSGQVWRGSSINSTRDGRLYHEAMSITPVLDKKNNITQYISIKRDISERVAYEKKILKSERRFHNIFQYAPLAILELEFTGLVSINKTKNEKEDFDTFIGKMIQIKSANKAALAFFKVQFIQQLFERPFLDCFENPVCLIEWLESPEMVRETLSCETILINFLQQKRFVVMTANIAFRDEDTSILMSFADITEFKVLQTQIRQSTRMATLGEMATGIAHEINQPLHVIRMANSMISDELNDKMDVNFITQRVQKIEKMVKRVNDIINHLRNFGHSSSTTFINSNPNDSITNALDMVNERLRLRSIVITLELEPNPPIIRSDPNSLEQVYINFLINAMDALDMITTKIQKRIIIKSKFSKDEKHFEITFSNNGPEIPLNVQDKIFDPFFTTKSLGKGTGLGLSISYGIIQSHKGELSVQSDETQTRFKVSLLISEESYRAEHKAE